LFDFEQIKEFTLLIDSWQFVMEEYALCWCYIRMMSYFSYIAWSLVSKSLCLEFCLKSARFYLQFSG